MSHPSRPTKRLLSALLVAAAIGCGDGRSDPDNPTGRAGQALLSDRNHAALVVEVDHVVGATPSPEALALLELRLNERCNKPGGIQIVVDDVIPTGQGTYTLGSVKQLEAEYRDYRTEPGRAAIYVLYLDGRSALDAGGQTTLGWAYSAESIALFKQSAVAISEPGKAGRTESAILIHELGHLFGLVNSGTSMIENHEDLFHPGHDTNPNCVMHYAVESTRVKNLLGETKDPPTQFGLSCVQDLRAIGGR